MPEPVVPSTSSTDATELETLRRTNLELTQKAATRKARIAELETSVGTATARATEAETRIRALTIDAPVMDVCEQISVAPQALRTALDADYKIEMKDGVVTLLNRTDDKPVTMDGKAVPLQAEAIKNLLLSSKDEGKLKLYRAIIIANKASGAGGASSQRATAAPVQHKHQFGLR
jgi:hypothetical protein